MRSSIKSLMFALLAVVLIASGAQARAQATLTCKDTYGNVSFVINITQFYFDAGMSSPRYFSVYTDLVNFNQLAYNEYFIGSFSECLFSPSNGTVPESVTIEDVAAGSTSAGTFALVTFSYNYLLLGQSGEAPMAVTKAVTGDEKSRALAAFQARIPAFSAPQPK